MEKFPLELNRGVTLTGETSLRPKECAGSSECGAGQLGRLAARQDPWRRKQGFVWNTLSPALKTLGGVKAGTGRQLSEGPRAGWWWGRDQQWGEGQEESKSSKTISQRLHGTKGSREGVLHTWCASPAQGVGWLGTFLFHGLVAWGRKNWQEGPQGTRAAADIRYWLLPGFFQRARSVSWVGPELLMRFGAPTCPKLAASFQCRIQEKGGGCPAVFETNVHFTRSCDWPDFKVKKWLRKGKI